MYHVVAKPDHEAFVKNFKGQPDHDQAVQALDALGVAPQAAVTSVEASAASVFFAAATPMVT